MTKMRRKKRRRARGFMPEAQREVDNRLLALPGRKVPMSWWMIYLKVPTHGGQVNLDMEDHRDEDFVKPKGTFKAFTGEGQKLGSTAPQVLNTSSPAQQAENEAKASSSISIDESQPTTNIQIRLADGGRLVQKFNHSHRISDIRLFIVDARPAMAATSFVLMTTFPNKELADENQTLKEANLLNAVIVQRLT
uniref:NSFL1 cofactor n=1 Tax=Molossus molossus TaxID=27622 RepID=A0A7J8HJE4_MOLMO|nr:NSFL1 cofactor [Molossus molossus]